MTAVLWLMGVQGLLGAWDTIYYHEWRARLPARADQMRPELRLHAARSMIYAVLFCTLPWVAWRGPAGALLVTLLAAEAVITFTDFVVEDRVRAVLGGVFPGERIMHAVMAIVYGAFLAFFVPVVGAWLTGGGPAPADAAMPPPVRGVLTALGVGSALSGLRDALASTGARLAAWPWAALPAHSPTPGRDTGPHPFLVIATGTLLLAAGWRARSRR